MRETIQLYNQELSFIVLSCFLIISSFVDVKKREIPVLLCIPVILLITGFRIIADVNFTEYVYVGLCLGFLYLCQAIFCTGSGGDVLLMMTVGYGMGLTGSLLAIIISGVFLVIYGITYKILHRKEVVMKVWYPVAPFISLGCAGAVLLQIYNVVQIDLWELLLNNI